MGRGSQLGRLQQPAQAVKRRLVSREPVRLTVSLCLCSAEGPMNGLQRNNAFRLRGVCRATRDGSSNSLIYPVEQNMPVAHAAWV